MKFTGQFIHIRKKIIAAAITLASTNLAAEGVLEGRISDQSGRIFFDGAQVSIEELNITTATKNGGRYRFNTLPAGNYRLKVSYVGADSVETAITVKDDQITSSDISIGENTNSMENVIVVGQAAGALSAINQMRSADNLVSIVTSDSIGQFPDENVSEALQRVSGVFIERDQGEGRFVGIRGLDPGLNVATINGLNVPSPEGDTRSVALDVIPSELVESLEVTKTLTPDQDGDAIGGTINIKSLSAFDRNGISYSLNAQAYYNDLESENGHKMSGTFTNIFQLGGGELGIALSASTNERSFGTDNIEADGGWETDDNGVRFHEELERRNYQITRERDGFALNLDYRADENNLYYFRTLYSNFADLELRNRIEFKLDEGDVTFDANSLTATDTEAQRELKDRYEEQEITSYMFGGENIIDRWTIEYSLGISEASEVEPGRIDSEFEYSDLASAGYNSTGPIPDVFFSADGLDTSNYELKELVLEDNSANDEQNSVRVDITYDTEFAGNPGFIKFGGKYRTRDKSSDVNVRIFEDFDDAFGIDQTLDAFVSGTTDYSLGVYGPYIDPALQRAFVNDNIGGKTACQLATYDEDNCAFILDEDGSLLDSARDYNIQEDITAFYIMSQVDMQNLRVTYGLRYEQTDFEANGFNVREVDVSGQDDVQVVATSFSNDYSDILPSINIRYTPTENLILRAAYTESIARPSFGDLSPTPDAIEIEEDGSDIELSVEAGNPELQPYESQNLDFAVEYYPEYLGILSAGLFYKSIDNFIFDADVSSIVPASSFAANIPVTDSEVFQPLNGANADLYGLEVAWTRQFSDLPSPFDGLLMMVNATFSDSDAELGLPTGGNRSNTSTLPLQADTVANFVVGYEKYGLSLRLSSAYVSDRIAVIDLEDESNDLYEDSHHQIDLTAKYDITENLQVFFNAINLNEEPNYRFYGSRNFNGQYDEIGQSYVLGVTYRGF